MRSSPSQNAVFRKIYDLLTALNIINAVAINNDLCGIIAEISEIDPIANRPRLKFDKLFARREVVKATADNSR